MICIHPTATHNKALLAALQVSTGLRVSHGQSYLRLVNQDGSTPRCKPAKRVTKTSPGNYPTGGNAA